MPTPMWNFDEANTVDTYHGLQSCVRKDLPIMMNNYTTATVVDTLQTALEQNNLPLARVALINLESRGIEVIQSVIDLIYPSTPSSNVIGINGNFVSSRPTMKELRKSKSLTSKARRLANTIGTYLDEFSMRDVILNSPTMYKVVDFFFDVFDDIEVEDEEEHEDDSNVVQIDFNKKK